MIYKDYLKTLTVCPFCRDSKTRSLIDNEYAYLTYALAPYHHYHLIVTPKRHEEKLVNLNWDEHVAIMQLILTGLKALDTIGHNDCTVLVRDEKAYGKSVKHIHYHIIPGGIIEDVSINYKVRKLLNTEEEQQLKVSLEEILKNV